MKRKDVINFAPQGVKGKKRLPLYVAVIILLCIAAFAVSMFVILAKNDFDLGKALGAREAENLTQAETTVKAPVSDEKNTAEAETDVKSNENTVNFLFLCASEEELTFCQVFFVNPGDNTVKVKPVSPDFTVETSEGVLPLRQAFLKLPHREIAEAFGKKNIPVSKYIFVTEENFVRLMKQVGSTPLTIGGNYEFNVDAVKYTFRQGTQNLTSDVLLKFLKFAEKGDAKLRLQANASADILRQHLNKENFSKGEKLFSSLINFVDSDITAFDYKAAEKTIEKMTESKTEISVIS